MFKLISSLVLVSSSLGLHRSIFEEETVDDDLKLPENRIPSGSEFNSHMMQAYSHVDGFPEAHFRMLVDAGSSGSRLYLFQYETAACGPPQIETLFSEVTRPGLSYFASEINSVGSALQRLFDHVMERIIELAINPKVIPLDILATAGMRSLPMSVQNALYHHLKIYIQENYPFQLHDLVTITGIMEGVYGWIELNYVIGAFQRNIEPLTSIDMGGSSTQIVHVLQPGDERSVAQALRVTIGYHSYTLASESFLGLGQDRALERMRQMPNAYRCYPIHYPFNMGRRGDFNFDECRLMYKHLIQEYHIKWRESMLQKNSVGFSALYHTYHFFNLSDQSVGPEEVEKRVNSVCHTPWKFFKKQHPKEPTEYLRNYCAHAAYFYELLYQTYHLQGARLNITNQLNGVSIGRWPIGALLMQISHENQEPDRCSSRTSI